MLKEINHDFFEGKRSEKIFLNINDTVIVTSGLNIGKECAVISIKKIKPEVEYLIEALDGSGDMVLEQKD